MIASMLLLLALPVAEPAPTAAPPSDYEVAAALAEEVASKKSSLELVNQYFSIIQASKLSTSFPDLTVPIAIQKVLERRALAKVTEAYGPYGALLLAQAAAALKLSSVAPPECTLAISYLKLAAADGQVGAMRRLAGAYSEGVCVIPSKYGSVEWLLKAAAAYREGGQREEAFGLAEEALAVVPEHPGAKALLQKLIAESTSIPPSPKGSHP